MRIWLFIVVSVLLCSIILVVEDALADGNHSNHIITVTAFGFPQPLSRTSGGTALITNDDFKRGNSVGIADMAWQIPGVSRHGDGAWGADINIRGLSRDSVIMAIDGVRVNTATDINARFGMVDPLDINRVEILKGPISSLYGSGSVGGIVNIVTKGAEFVPDQEQHFGLSGTYRNNPSGFGTIGFAQLSSARHYVYASQTFRDYESYTDGAGEEVCNSQYRDAQTKFRAGWLAGEIYKAELNFQHFDGREIGIPGSGTAPLPSGADVTYPITQRGLLSVVQTLSPKSGVWKNSILNTYYQYIDRRVRIDNFPAISQVKAIYPRADHRTWGAKLLNSFVPDNHKILFGLDVWERLLRGSYRYRIMANGGKVEDQPLPNANYLSAGLFAEEDWSISRGIIVNAGGRVDAVRVENDSTDHWDSMNVSEGCWNMHAGATVWLSDEWRLKAVAASAYRAATLEERYQYLELGGGVTKWGDPDLEPERSLFFECGTDWIGDGLTVELSGYCNELSDMIGEKIVDSSTIVNANVDSARICGAEIAYNWHVFQKINAHGNIAYITGTDLKTDESLPGIAP
ncbi:MAG: TonB-dependent receptor, partial [Lentisphaerae bacterium]|nr:TonB-dependent receptor [Lentisphaerota bacterium]